jgi:hypothetical protein
VFAASSRGYITDVKLVFAPIGIIAGLLAGAIFRLTKGLVDHGVRGGFARATGRWPGDKRAESS